MVWHWFILNLFNSFLFIMLGTLCRKCKSVLQLDLYTIPTFHNNTFCKSKRKPPTAKSFLVLFCVSKTHTISLWTTVSHWNSERAIRFPNPCGFPPTVSPASSDRLFQLMNDAADQPARPRPVTAFATARYPLPPPQTRLPGRGKKMEIKINLSIDINISPGPVRAVPAKRGTRASAFNHPMPLCLRKFFSVSVFQFDTKPTDPAPFVSANMPLWKRLKTHPPHPLVERNVEFEIETYHGFPSQCVSGFSWTCVWISVGFFPGMQQTPIPPAPQDSWKLCACVCVCIIFVCTDRFNIEFPGFVSCFLHTCTTLAEQAPSKQKILHRTARHTVSFSRSLPLRSTEKESLFFRARCPNKDPVPVGVCVCVGAISPQGFHSLRSPGKDFAQTASREKRLRKARPLASSKKKGEEGMLKQKSTN